MAESSSSPTAEWAKGVARKADPLNQSVGGRSRAAGRRSVRSVRSKQLSAGLPPTRTLKKSKSGG